MLKTRKRWISLLVALTFLLSLLPAGVAFAGDPVKFSSAYALVNDADDQPVGWIRIVNGDQKVVAPGYTLYVTITLPSGTEWSTEPNSDDAVKSVVEVYGDGVSDVNIARVASSANSLQFKVSVAAAAYVDEILIQGAGLNLDVAKGTKGEIAPTVVLQALDGSNLHVWSQTATPVIAKVREGKLTASAATPKKISGPGVEVKVADIFVEENEPGVLEFGDEITLTIKTDGVTWVADTNPTVSGTSTLRAVYESRSADNKVLTYSISAPSTGIGGKLTFDMDPAAPTNGYLNIGPNVSGDIVIEVASTNTALADTEVVVATTAVGAFTVTAKDIKDREGVPGQAGVEIGDLEIDQNFRGAFANNGSLVLTLKNAKWAADTFGTFDGMAKGSLYNDNRSFWYVVTDPNNVPDPLLIDLPKVNLDATASGDIVVEVSGTAGPSGEYVVGKVIAAATIEAAKPAVNVNALDQAAGDIKITEAKKNLFNASGDLVLTLPNGIYFSKNPKVYLNGKEVSYTPGSGTGKGYGKLTITGGTFSLSSAKADVIEIKEIRYDVDSRFAAKDIVVAFSGQFLTGAGGSDKTVATVANAVGVSPTAAEAVLTIGSTTMTVNGKEVTMDVAPYLKDGRTFLPVRFAANAVGVSDANIIWDGANQRVTILKGDRIVQMTIGEKTLLLNGASIPMDVAPEVVPPGRTMLPIRFLAMALGADIAWNPDTQTVTIKVE